MKGNKFVSMGVAILTAAVLWAAPVWAENDGVGSPWFDDNEAIDNSVPQSGKTIKIDAVHPSGEDSGDPEFHDTKEEKPIMKPVTTFKVSPVKPSGEDTGDPEFHDTKENN